MPMFRLILMVLCGLGTAVESQAQQVQAVMGEPFGVARVSLPLPIDTDDAFVRSGGFQIVDPQGRVFYPVFDVGRFGEFAAELLGTDALIGGNRLNVSFLFRGTEPFEITVLTPRPQGVRITPTPDRQRRGRQALTRWWRGYNAQVRTNQAQGDYSPLVETYLVEMLSSRLNLEKPLLSRVNDESRSELQQRVQLLFGSEQLREAVLRDIVRGRLDVAAPAEIPVPPERVWPAVKLPEGVAAAKVEEIAGHVPEECFYIRFGSFQNYLWFDRLKDDYGGDIGRMVTLRGQNPQHDEKVQNQLALLQSSSSELFGPQVISDVALIGRDLYLADGPALGMLFQASNGLLLGASLTRDRQEILKREKGNGAVLETVRIGDRDVSFLSTPDQRIRSFYAVDGNLHFITTSRTLVERFYEAGQGIRPLATTAEFQYARRRLPLEREDTIFAYFSTAFFRALLSPRYQIELSRRLQSLARMDLVELARLAAAGEGHDETSVRELVRLGFLPKGFVADDARRFHDPVRGARGTFIPIPDVELTGITRSELQDWERCARFLESAWPEMDPLMVGVKRFALEGERLERIVIDANVSPLVEEKYGWLLSMIGPPTDVLIQPNPDDVITVQMALQGGLLKPAIAPHHLLLGIRDAAGGDGLIPDGLLSSLRLLRSTPGYIGAWPKLGLLDLIPFINTPPDANGFSQLPLGLWRWQGRGFSIVSFQPDVISEAARHLEAVPTENPAQIRLRVGDLMNSRLAGWVNTLNYGRAYQTSLGNVRLFNTLSQQFRVVPEQSQTTAADLLNTRFTCSLLGEYEFQDRAGFRSWRSTHWPTGNRVPEEYQAPLLSWFRGATADLSKPTGEMSLHAEIDMLRKEREPAVKLPLFNLFGGGNPDKK